MPTQDGIESDRSNTIVQEWVASKLDGVAKSVQQGEEFHPVIEEFRRLIEDDEALYMGFHRMFEQVSREAPYTIDRCGNPQVRNLALVVLTDH